MGKRIIIAGADFSENAIPGVEPAEEWMGGLTSAAGAGAAGTNGSAICSFKANSNTNLNGHTWDYLLGKTIKKIRVWVGYGGTSVDFGYYNSSNQFIVLKNFTSVNYVSGNPAWSDISSGFNEYVVNETIPSDATAIAWRINGGQFIITTGAYGALNNNWKGLAENGTARAYTPFIDFLLA